MMRARPLLSPAAPVPSVPPGMSMAKAVGLIRASGLFDERLYIESYAIADPMVRLVDPISHYIVIGALRGFLPSPGCQPGPAEPGINPLLRQLLAEGPPLRERAPSGWRKAAPRGEWRQPAATPSPSGRRSPERRAAADVALDVIMPVFAGRAETLEALDCVLTSANRTPHELVVVDDGSPDAELRAALGALAAQGRIRLLTNATNEGYVRAVNRALDLHATRDAILLNSDTRVHGDWIDRLRAHAAPDVATVTPFSNNAVHCSYPRIFEDNAIPAGMTERELDGLAGRVNRGESTEIPFGVGFCMYVSRAALTEAGGFDADTFGKGYGEEADFCLRAARLGYRNLHALDVFVYHKGSVSFGGEAPLLQDSHLARLRDIHPEYAAKVRNFSLRDPALEARRRLDACRLFSAAGEGERVICFQPEKMPSMAESLLAEGAKLQFAVMQAEPDGRTVSLRSHGDPSGTPNLRHLALGGPGSPLEALLRLAAPDRLVLFRTPTDAAELIAELECPCRALGIACVTAGGTNMIDRPHPPLRKERIPNPGQSDD
jgi:GT2 family glycosyltransferase